MSVRLAARNRRSALLALLLLFLPGCLVHQPSGRLEPLTTASATELCCTPLLLAVFGRDDGTQAIVGGGSGVAVHDRIILTAGHVVPQEARFVVVRAGGAAPAASADPSRPPIPFRAQGFRIRRVVRGGGDATSEGDWALLILDRPLTRVGARCASCLCAADAAPPPSGSAVVIAGFPFPPSRMDSPSDEDMTDRDPILLRTTLSGAPPASGARGRGDHGVFLYADYTPDRVDLSGLSGGPVFIIPPLGGTPILIGIHIATGVSRLGQITLGRSAVIRRLPVEAIQKAIAELPPPPPPRN